jgi:hypothetical protein
MSSPIVLLLLTIGSPHAKAVEVQASAAAAAQGGMVQSMPAAGLAADSRLGIRGGPEVRVQGGVFLLDDAGALFPGFQYGLGLAWPVAWSPHLALGPSLFVGYLDAPAWARVCYGIYGCNYPMPNMDLALAGSWRSGLPGDLPEWVGQAGVRLGSQYDTVWWSALVEVDHVGPRGLLLGGQVAALGSLTTMGRLGYRFPPR